CSLYSLDKKRWRISVFEQLIKAFPFTGASINAHLVLAVVITVIRQGQIKALAGGEGKAHPVLTLVTGVRDTGDAALGAQGVFFRSVVITMRLKNGNKGMGFGRGHAQHQSRFAPQTEF